VPAAAAADTGLPRTNLFRLARRLRSLSLMNIVQARGNTLSILTFEILSAATPTHAATADMEEREQMEQQQGGLIHIFLAGGLVMWPLLAIFIAAAFFTVNRIMEFGKAGKSGSGLTDEVINLVQQGRESEALSRVENEPGPVAQSLATILRSRHLPIEDIERQVEVGAEDYMLRLERYLPALDTFTTLSPLLGLLGTILGMVKVFQQFTANANDNAAKQKILAGVGESLYATAFGIFIAVCCFAIYNYFSAKQRSISIETSQAATRLIAVLHERQAIHH